MGKDLYISINLLLIVSAAVKGTCEEQWPSPSKVSTNGICASLLQTRGYMCEEHHVTTDDGYILSLVRIPNGRSHNNRVKRTTVFLQHGILLDATSWFLGSGNESPAFALADNGFDVWLASARGTKYSRGHTKLSPSDMAYWEWSWDELATYDVPASVQYVYNQTGRKMHYVGYSLGTLTGLAAFSQGMLVDMVRSAALLTPIAHLNQIRSLPLRIAADLSLAYTIYAQGIREFIPKGETVAKILEAVCNSPAIHCSDLLNLITGPNCCVDSSMINNNLDHILQSTSTKNLIHLTQGIKSRKIVKYDYIDPVKNMQHYGQASPPIYDMKSIPKDLPLFLSHGLNDFLSDVNDVHVLLDELKDHDKDKLVILSRVNYAHLDFLSATNAKEMVYEPMMAFFRCH